MTWQMYLVLGLAIATVGLLAFEAIAADVIAIGVAAILLVTGVLEPEEGFAGFASPATIAVGAMFVLSASLTRTGAVEVVGKLLVAISRRNALAGQLAMMVGVAVLSAFLNNTAAVAILIPVVLATAKAARTSPSRLLMPLSFASMFGGVCTLIGTSTNLLGNSIAVTHGQPAFGMFEFSALGLVFFAAGTAYMVTVGRWLVPERRDSAQLGSGFGLGDYVTDVALSAEASSVGRALGDAPLLAGSDIQVLQIVRGEKQISLPSADVVLEANDVLRLLCRVDDVAKLRDTEGVTFAAVPWDERAIAGGDVELVEVVVAPNSLAVGTPVARSGLREHGATVLALRKRRGELVRGDVRRARLRPGDALLLEVPLARLDMLHAQHDFLVVSRSPLVESRRRRIPIALAIMVAVVAVAAANLLPISVSAVAGAVLMVLTRCLTPSEAYEAIEWRVLFLLSGMLALGAAMEKTGVAHALVDGAIGRLAWLGPAAILSGLYLLTSVLTEVLSNNAAVVLLAPIAIATAESLHASPRPFLIAVMFAASSSFMTPIGYQTNTMIYGPGQYRFTDFLRVGAPLNIVFWLIATLLIPYLWPLA